MENLSPSTRQQPIPSTSSVAEQEKEETQERPSLVLTTSLPLPSEALEQGSTYKENSKTVSLETPTTEYSWLKEVEVAMPKCFVQRKMRRMFLEKVTASGDRRNLVRNTSLPLPSRAFKQGAICKEKVSKISPSTRQQPIPSTSSVAKHEKQEKQDRPSLVRTTSLSLPNEALEQGATYKKNSKTVSFETPAMEYRWLKELEVAMPKCFIQRKMRRMFLEEVIASGDLQVQIKERKTTFG